MITVTALRSRCDFWLSLVRFAGSWGLLSLPESTLAMEVAQVPASVPLPPIQDIQPPTQPTFPPVETPLPPPDQLLEPPNVSEPLLEPLPNVPGTITVERFEVTGSSVFSPAKLEKVTAEFVQRPLTLSELFQVRTAITQLYVSQGYINSGAYIPPQKIEEGVVRIQVVEGKLAEIQVTGNRRLRSDPIRSRLALAGGPPLNQKQLLEALQLLQLNPLIESISAELSAGTQPGTSILTVRVTEATSFDLQLGLDNARSPSVGSDRRQVQIVEANLLGFGDSLSIAGANTDGSNTLDVSYTLPISPRDTTINLSYSTSSSRVIEEPVDVLDIASSSRAYDLTLRHPLVQTPTQEVAIGLTASRRESEATLLDGELPFPTLGADAEGDTKISVLRFFQDYTHRSNRDVIALRSQFSWGVDALGTTFNPSPPNSRFFAWRGQAQYVRLLAPDTLLFLRSEIQYGDRPLVSLEQFGLGGIQSVRGYRQDTLLTDSGFFASAELRVPILHIPKINGLLQLAPFIDTGFAWSQGVRNEPDLSNLTSVGLGLRFQAANQLTMRLDWGIPLTVIGQQGDTLQENGLYFSVLYNPF